VFVVGVNLQFLHAEVVGGGRTYVEKLIGSMQRIDGVRCVLIVNSSMGGRFHEEGYRDVVEFENEPFSHGRRLWFENIGVTKRIEVSELDVLFSPGGAGAPLLPVRVPQVVTVHDLFHLWYPEKFSAVRRLARRLWVPLSLWRAERVIAVSEFTACDVRRKLGVGRPKIDVVYEGVDHDEIPDAAAARRTADELGAADEYFVYPASTGPNKNHRGLLEAYGAFQGVERERDVGLVLCGAGTESESGIGTALEELGLEDVVTRLGVVSRPEVWALVKAARALLYPSLFEGFGLPPLEAMACGTPVVASNRASIPEVVGDAGMLLPPHDRGGWRDAMVQLAESDEYCDRLSEKGRERAAAFSWERAAEETLTVLRRAADSAKF